MLALFISFIAISNAQEFIPDCALVKTIYESLGGPEAQESGCCQISGTQCLGQFVTEITWNNRNLKGQMPAQISQLINLEKIGLANNWITGHIPTEIGIMTKLKILNLNQNNLSGEIPSSLDDLKVLEKLNLDVEKFCGSIPDGIVRFTGNRQTLKDCETSSGNAASTTHVTTSLVHNAVQTSEIMTRNAIQGGNQTYGYKYIAEKYKNGGIVSRIPILSAICFFEDSGSGCVYPVFRRL